MSTASEQSEAGGEAELLAQLEAGADALGVAEDFFGLSDLVRAHTSLRRSLTDPGRAGADKRRLVADLFGPRVQPATTAVLGTLVEGAWSAPEDLHDACEVMGIVAALESSRRHGGLQRVERELFWIAQVLRENRDLRVQLSDLGVGSRRERSQFAVRLFSGRVSPMTLRLLRRAVGRTSHGRIIQTLRRYAQRAAALQGRVLATVETASPLRDAQVARLQQILERKLGRRLTVNVALNPGLVGGFRVRVGSDTLDSSVRWRLAGAREAVVR